jgi:hypothetical protein
MIKTTTSRGLATTKDIIQEIWEVLRGMIPTSSSHSISSTIIAIQDLFLLWSVNSRPYHPSLKRTIISRRPHPILLSMSTSLWIMISKVNNKSCIPLIKVVVINSLNSHQTYKHNNILELQSYSIFLVLWQADKLIPLLTLLINSLLMLLRF